MLGRLSLSRMLVVGENAPNDSCGSSGDPITTAPIDLEIVDPDPVPLDCSDWEFIKNEESLKHSTEWACER